MSTEHSRRPSVAESTYVRADRGRGSRPLIRRDVARALLGHVIGLVALTLGCLALGAVISRNLSGRRGIALFIGALACVFDPKIATSRGRERLAIGLLFGLGLLLGLAAGTLCSCPRGRNRRRVTCCCNRSLSDVRRTSEERAVIDRLQRLSGLLPALAQEAPTARREAARLRAENRRLTRRLAEAESLALVPSPTATKEQI